MNQKKVFSILESLLFASPEPKPLSTFLKTFDGEFSEEEILLFLEEFKQSLTSEERGLVLEQVNQCYQLRTKPENKEYLVKYLKPKAFRLSGPSLETLSIIAYNQPCLKQDVDQIRGIESGHLIRKLMEKGLIIFDGKSNLPGKPSFYKTSEKFLEVFGFNSLKDLPSEEEIQDLLPEAHNSTEEKEKLHQVTDTLSESVSIPHHEYEKENEQIKETLKTIPTTVDALIEADEKPPEEEPSL